MHFLPRVVDLLQNGAIFSKVFQPYEAHIPYLLQVVIIGYLTSTLLLMCFYYISVSAVLLQFLIDFNLYGMNFLHARKVFFRGFSTFGMGIVVLPYCTVCTIYNKITIAFRCSFYFTILH